MVAARRAGRSGESADGVPEAGDLQDVATDIEPPTGSGSTKDTVADTETTPVKSVEPSRKRGRTPMPSWDEIVFGSRGDSGS